MPNRVKEIEKKDFRKWLQSRKAFEIVGNAGSPRHCPLATFFTNLGYEQPAVYGATLEFQEGGLSNIQSLPEWARRFVDKVDGKYDNNLVTSSQALRTLDWWRF